MDGNHSMCGVDNPTLDVKPLSGSPDYRLCVSGWRVLFTREDVLRVIAIEQIKPRGYAYKWADH